MLRIVFLLLATAFFGFTANAAKTPIKLHSSAAFNQQAPTTSPYTPSSSNCNCPSASGQTPNNRNTATPAAPQPYAPGYYAPSANAPTTPTATNNPSTTAGTPSSNGSILLSAPSPATGNQKTNNSGWTIT